MKFKGRRSGTREAQKILRDQVHHALQNLGRGKPTAEDIHEARKDIKRARATLRLLRDAISRKAYGKENDTLRKAAHPLSAARDAKVMVDTLDRMVEQRADANRIGGIKGLRRKLANESERARRRVTGGADGTRRARKLLHTAESRAKRLPVGRHGWSRLGKGLMRLYQQGHDCLDQVRAEPTVARLHAWRKSTKYLYHQLQLLEPLCPRTLKAFTRGMHRLSDELGDDHDLAVLREQVARDTAIFPDEASRTSLLTVIERSRTTLQKRALLSGARLYREDPARFEKRLHRYWRQYHR
jgi:CHAD domain-containing protein